MIKKSTLLVLLLIIPVNAVDSRPDGAYRLNLNLEGSLQNPSFSPNGDSIVFTRFRNGYNKGPSDLYTYNLDTEQLHLLVSEGSDNVNLPGNIWMNNKIIFSSSRDPHDEIYMIDANGSPGDEVKITSRNGLVAYEPSFSRDGLWVLFETHILDEEDGGIITKYKVDGSSGYIELTSSATNAKQPNFSPTQDIISYQKLVGDQWSIWLINNNGTDNHKLTSGEGSKTDASFSADGEWIIYSEEIPETDSANLYRVSINGSITEKLTTYYGYDGAASFFENYVVFESCEGDPDRSDGTSIWIRDINEVLIKSYETEDGFLNFISPMLFIVTLAILKRRIRSGEL